MRFMISSSDRALARADFRRFWPLLFGYAVVWLCALPLALWSNRRWIYDATDSAASLASVNSHLWGCTAAAPIISACFAVLLAMALYAYLMNGRSVGLLHALPVTRGRQFYAHFSVGVLMFTVVHLATALISLPVQAGCGAIDMRGTLEWFAAAELTGLFFFALATLCAMITGWLLAVPVIYVGVNFMFAAFYALFAFLAQAFLWGYESVGWPAWLDWLTPTVRLYQQITTGESTLIPDTQFRYYAQHLSASGWTTLLVYTAVAAALIAAAYFFYRARHSETAGDAIVFPWLRPVVLYVISLAGGMGLGILLWYMVSGGGSMTVLVLCQIVTGLIVYFGVQMLLHKSFRVFTRRGWLGGAVLAVVLTVIALVIRFDVLGFAGYVPNADRIESADVSGGSNIPYVRDISDPEGLEKLTALHRAVLAQGKPDDAALYQADGSTSADEGMLTFSVSYTMKDGGIVRRYYHQIVRRGTPLYQAYNDFYNDPAVRKASSDSRFYLAEIDPAAIIGGWFNNYRQDTDSVELTAPQARQLYMALDRYLEARRAEAVDVLAPERSGANSGECYFYLEFNYQDNTSVSTQVPGSTAPTAANDADITSWGIDMLPADCTEVLDLLVSFGLAETADELLYD